MQATTLARWPYWATATAYSGLQYGAVPLLLPIAVHVKMLVQTFFALSAYRVLNGCGTGEVGRLR